MGLFKNNKDLPFILQNNSYFFERGALFPCPSSAHLAYIAMFTILNASRHVGLSLCPNIIIVSKESNLVLALIEPVQLYEFSIELQ